MKPRVNVTELTIAQLLRLHVTVDTLPLLFTRVNITRQWKSTFRRGSTLNSGKKPKFVGSKIRSICSRFVFLLSGVFTPVQ